MLGLEHAQLLAAEDAVASYEGEDEFELNDILQFAAAAVVDVAVTTADSVTLGQFDLETKDVLYGLGAGMGLGEYYEKHKDGIELASFVGGLVVPGLAASKALKLARARSTPFATMETVKLEHKARALKIAETEGFATAELTSAIRSARLWTVGEGVAESIVYEAAFITFMNQHSYMEENYDLGDAAIGVALGSIMGPLRLIGLNRDLKSATSAIESSRLEKNVLPQIFNNDDPTMRLPLTGWVWEKTRKADMTGVPGDGVRLQENAAEEMHLQTARVINEMWEGSSKQANNVIRPKVGAVAFPGEYTSIYDAVTPLDIVINGVKANPKGFMGVKQFGIFDSTTDDAVAGLFSPLNDLNSGLFTMPSANKARSLLLYKEARVTTSETADQLRKRIPEGMDLWEDAHSLIIATSQKPGRKGRQWMSDFLGLPHLQAKEVTFAGPMGKFRVSKEVRAREGHFKMLETWDAGARSWNSMIDEIYTASDGAVFHPNLPGVFTGVASAMSAQTASMREPTRKALMKLVGMGWTNPTKAFEPFKTASHKIDGDFITELLGIKVSGTGMKPTIKEDNITSLQAWIAHAKQPNSQFRDLSIQIGKDTRTLTTTEQAVELLRTKKAELLDEGLTQGFSPLQLSVNLNIPYATIEDFVEKGRKLTGDFESIALYTDIVNPAKYLKQNAIAVRGNSAIRGAVEEVNTTVMLDENVAMTAHKNYVTNIANTTQSRGGELSEMDALVFRSPEMEELVTNLPKVLATHNKKNVLLLSADHAIRELGPLGDHITTMAKNFNRLVNNQINRYKTELDLVLPGIAQHPASASQFALMRQAVHGHSIAEAADFVVDLERGVIVKTPANAELGVEEVLLTYANSGKPIIMTDQIKSFMGTYTPIMRENLALYNAGRVMGGKPKARGAGVWFPYDPIQKEFVGYKINRSDVTDIELVVANTAKELEENIDSLFKQHGDTYKVITRAGAEDHWNQLNRHSDLEQLRVADVSREKRGLTSGVAVPGAYEISRFMQSMTNDTWAKYRQIFRYANAPVFDQLEFAARQATSPVRSTGLGLAQKVQKKVTNPELVSNMLLGRSMMQATPIMDMVNNATSVAMNNALNVTNRAWLDFKNETGGALTGKRAEAAWLKHVEELKADDIPVPWKSASEYMIALGKSKNLDMAQHKIAAAQSILVTANLRFMEAAHAMVTVASIPVIMTGELLHQKMPLRTMIDAVKFMSGKSDEAIQVMGTGKRLGHTTGIVAETTRLMEDLHTSSSFLDKHKKIIDTLSLPSDSAENYAREFSYALGYLIAKKKYPTNSRALNLSHAAAFTSRTMGNYASKQKPTLFQGSFGSMVGLYQTFMLTMGQNMFRYAEAGDTRAAMGLLTSQGGMFGMESLPFFQDFNQLIGEYVSNEHNDIRTTTYNVFGNAEEKSVARAEFLLFGLPSTVMGSGFYTRGQLAPRGPLSFSGEGGFSFKPALLDAAIQANNVAWETASSIATALGTGGGIADMAEAGAQGFAAQSLWRPGARIAEIMMGKSFDQKGELISTREEVMEPSALLARILSTRPLKEQALRNLKFQSSYYEGVDRDRRSKVIKQLRRLASDGETMDNADQLYAEYIQEGGSQSGWTDIYKRAYQASGTDFAQRVSDYASKQPAIINIAEMYSN